MARRFIRFRVRPFRFPFLGMRRKSFVLLPSLLASNITPRTATTHTGSHKYSEKYVMTHLYKCRISRLEKSSKKNAYPNESQRKYLDYNFAARRHFASPPGKGNVVSPEPERCNESDVLYTFRRVGGAISKLTPFYIWE